jgi:endonuclease YncB( thermonuclease family)
MGSLLAARTRLLPLAVLIVALALAAAARAEEFGARVTWVIDGDSFRIERMAPGGGRDECRMRAYNAPEMTGPEAEDGRRALRRMIALIAKNEIMVRTERRDRYGRLVCDAWLADGTDVTASMRAFLHDYPWLDKYKSMY